VGNLGADQAQSSSSGYHRSDVSSGPMIGRLEEPDWRCRAAVIEALTARHRGLITQCPLCVTLLGTGWRHLTKGS
jgi:hypothetical protein